MLIIVGILALICTFIPNTTKASPLLHQVYYDAPGTDGLAVFTELSGPKQFSLDGWSLQGVNGDNQRIYRSISLSGSRIGQDGFLLLAPASALASLSTSIDVVANVDWQNGPDGVYLLNPAGTVIDALFYGQQNLPPEILNPAPDLAPGRSLIRKIVGKNTGDNSMDFTVSLAPRPSQRAYAPLPEPAAGTLLLVGVGLVFLRFLLKFKR